MTHSSAAAYYLSHLVVPDLARIGGRSHNFCVATHPRNDSPGYVRPTTRAVHTVFEELMSITTT